MARLSLWRMDSTFVRVFFFLAMCDFLCWLYVQLIQKAADEILCVPRVGDFDERPAAETAVVVDSRDPQRARGGNFGGLVLLFLAGDFDDQVQEVIRAATIVDAGDEVGDVVLLLAVQRIGNAEAEVVIFDVADDLGHGFECFGHLLLPRVSIGDDVRDVTLIGEGREDRPRCIEIHITGGSDGVIRAEDGLERKRAVGRGDDGLVDAVRCVVRGLDQQQQLREGVVLERDAFIKPAFGNAEQLREEPMLHLAVKLVLFGSISPYVAILPEILFQSELGEKEGDFVGPAAFEIVEGVDAGFADDGRVLGPGGDIGSGKCEPGFVGEGRGQPFTCHVVAVAEQPGKGDLAGRTVFQGRGRGWAAIQAWGL